MKILHLLVISLLTFSCSTIGSINTSDRFEEKNAVGYTRIIIVNSVPEKKLQSFVKPYNADYIEYMPYHGPVGLVVSNFLYKTFYGTNPAMLRIRDDFIAFSKKHEKLVFIVPNEAKYLFRNILKKMDDSSLSKASGYVWLVGESKNTEIEELVKNVSSGRILVKYGDLN